MSGAHTGVSCPCFAVCKGSTGLLGHVFGLRYPSHGSTHLFSVFLVQTNTCVVLGRLNLDESICMYIHIYIYIYIDVCVSQVNHPSDLLEPLVLAPCRANMAFRSTPKGLLCLVSLTDPCFRVWKSVASDFRDERREFLRRLPVQHGTGLKWKPVPGTG